VEEHCSSGLEIQQLFYPVSSLHCSILHFFGNSFNPTSLVPSNIGGFQLTSSQLAQIKASILSQTFGGAATYISYLTAGIISLILVFNMAFGGIDLVLDRQLGFLNTLLTAPISRASIYFLRSFSKHG
jgi:hypothetical protein